MPGHRCRRSAQTLAHMLCRISKTLHFWGVSWVTDLSKYTHGGGTAAAADDHSVAAGTAVRRINRWDAPIALRNAARNAGTASNAVLLAAVHPVGIPILQSGPQHPFSGANVGVGGHAQQACQGLGCKNHRVLGCSYGLCTPCCAKIKRDPRCGVSKHNKRNTHH